MRIEKTGGEYELTGAPSSADIPAPWRWVRHAGPEDGWGFRTGAWLAPAASLADAAAVLALGDSAYDVAPDVAADVAGWQALLADVAATPQADVAEAHEDGGESNPRGPHVPPSERFNASPWGEGDDGYR